MSKESTVFSRVPMRRLLLPFMTFVLFWCMAPNVCAGVVHSYKSQNPDASESICFKRDRDAIEEELNDTGYAELVSGESYYLKTLNIKSGWTIDAKDAILYCSGGVVNHSITATDYNSLKNVTIRGGKWRNSSGKGFDKTSFHFIHAQNIKLLDMDIQTASYKGHSIELVACKNVTIQNCTITPLGSPKADCLEEQIQIDIATMTTFPNFEKSGGAKFANGATCSNIKIIGCTVTGARAVCANYAKREKKYYGKYHSNITVKNCKLTGKTSEALTLFNTTSATVTGNTLISEAPVKRDSYACGLHFYLAGKNKTSAKGTINISKNTIKGSKYALMMSSVTSAKYGTITLKNNKMYSKLYKKKGKTGKSDVKYIEKSRKKLTDKGNKAYKW